MRNLTQAKPPFCEVVLKLLTLSTAIYDHPKIKLSLCNFSLSRVRIRGSNFYLVALKVLDTHFLSFFLFSERPGSTEFF